MAVAVLTLTFVGHVTNNLRRAPHSISELLSSSGVYCNGPCQLHSLPPRHAVESVEVSEAKHHFPHGGTGTTFLEVLAQVPDVVNAWKAHMLSRTLKYDSFPHTGKTCYARSNQGGERSCRELARGLVF